MTSLEYDILICPPADHKLWTQWRSLVESERWIADDHSVTHLTPGCESTRCVAAVTKGLFLINFSSVIYCFICSWEYLKNLIRDIFTCSIIDLGRLRHFTWKFLVYNLFLMEFCFIRMYPSRVLFQYFVANRF